MSVWWLYAGDDRWIMLMVTATVAALSCLITHVSCSMFVKFEYRAPTYFCNLLLLVIFLTFRIYFTCHCHTHVCFFVFGYLTARLSSICRTLERKGKEVALVWPRPLAAKLHTSFRWFCCFTSCCIIFPTSRILPRWSDFLYHFSE